MHTYILRYVLMTIAAQARKKVLFPCLRVIVFVIYELRSIFLR